MKKATLAIDIISIQSQVVYGHVGNNAVIPVLQAHGLNVCAVPTVYYSNTPLYPSLYGDSIPPHWFEGYLQALHDREVLKHCRHIMLGYLGSQEQAEILTNWLTGIRRDYPHITIQIDPVLGDIDCGLYVDESLAKNYREQLRHLATGMTPNHFELEYLTGKKLNTLEETIDAARSLLSEHTQWIITTSAAPQTWQKDEMQIVIVEKEKIEVQKHHYYQTQAQGTGDTFAALLTTFLLRGESLSSATLQASQQVMEIVKRTNLAGTKELQLIPHLFSQLHALS